MERPTKGDTVQIVTETESYIRKIIWVGDNHIEWKYGWCKIEQLKEKKGKGRTKFVYS